MATAETADLRKTGRAYVPGFLQRKPEDQDQAKKETERKIRSILNKIAPQNFESCFSQLISTCDIGSIGGLSACVDIVFEMAIGKRFPQNLFVELAICQRLTYYRVTNPGDQVERGGDGRFACFGHLLLRRCQKMFETPLTDPAVRHGYYGNIRFMAGLHLMDVATGHLIQHCVAALLDQSSNASQSKIGDSLLGLYEMLRIAGKKLDGDSKVRSQVDGWFERIDRLIGSKWLEPSLRSNIRHLVELRQSGWQLQTQRAAAGVPVTSDGGCQPALLPRYKLKRRSRIIMGNWLNCVCSLEDTKASFLQIAQHPDVRVFVQVSAEHLLGGNSWKTRQKGGHLLFELLHCELLSSRNLVEGFSSVMEMAEDFLSDFPLLASYLGEIFSSFVQKAASYLQCVQQLLLRVPADLRDSSRRPLRGEILSRALHLASGRLGHDRVGAAFREAAIAWPDLLQLSQAAAAEFVSANQLEFTRVQ